MHTFFVDGPLVPRITVVTLIYIFWFLSLIFGQGVHDMGVIDVIFAIVYFFVGFAMVCFFSLNLLRQATVLRDDKMTLFDLEYQTVQSYNQLHEGCIILKDGQPIFTNTTAHKVLYKACQNVAQE